MRTLMAFGLLLALLPCFAAAREETGKLYIDESYVDADTGELHIVISPDAVAQFKQDLANGQVAMNVTSSLGADKPSARTPAPQAKLPGQDGDGPMMLNGVPVPTVDDNALMMFQNSMMGNTADATGDFDIPSLEQIFGLNPDEFQQFYEANPSLLNDAVTPYGFENFNSFQNAYNSMQGQMNEGETEADIPDAGVPTERTK